MENLYFVIMAGGAGTRFWPASTPKRPKQFLPLGPSDESLIAETYRRCRSLADPDHIIVVTSVKHAELTREALPDLPEGNLLLEPVGRNTAPCVGWASREIASRTADAVVAVLPADHHIADETEYTRILSLAAGVAKSGGVVTVGIKPSRPETGYGYIEMGEERSPEVFVCERFVEKPPRDRAEEFLRQGNFLWNSGMFFFRADEMLDAISEHLPELYAGLEKMFAAGSVLQEVFPTLPSVSIDHGVMEKLKGVRVVPASFGWSDLGSWETAWELSENDEAGNASSRPLGGQTLFEDSRNCYVAVDGDKPVALLGVSDLVVVDTGESLLIMPRERSQDVKQVVQQLRALEAKPED